MSDEIKEIPEGMKKVGVDFKKEYEKWESRHLPKILREMGQQRSGGSIWIHPDIVSMSFGGYIMAVVLGQCGVNANKVLFDMNKFLLDNLKLNGMQLEKHRIYFQMKKMFELEKKQQEIEDSEVNYVKDGE